MWRFKPWGVLESDIVNAKKARKLFKKALTQSRNSAHTLQPEPREEARHLEAAQKLWKEHLKEWPKSTRARLTLAEIHELRGDIEKARKTFELGRQ